MIFQLPGKLRRLMYRLTSAILLLCGLLLLDKRVACTQHSLNFDSQMAVFSY